MERMALLGSLQSPRPTEAGKPVCCNPAGNCWCMKLTPVASPADSEDGVCLTPAQMLARYGNLLPAEDVAYLRSLVGRPTLDFEENALA